MAYVVIAVVGSLASVVLAVVARVPTYRVAPVFLVPVIWGVYWVRRWLNVRPVHYAMFVGAVLLHNLGALGWYQRWPGGFSFDIVVHFYFGVVAGVLFFRVIEGGARGLKTWRVYVATLMFVMGSGAIHELMEYASTLVLGEERGMVKTSGYKYDTQRDLLNNLLGVCVALGGMGMARAWRGRDALPHSWPENASRANQETGGHQDRGDQNRKEER